MITRRGTLIGAASALALVGCGGGGGRRAAPPLPAQEARMPVAQRAPRWGDDDPVDWPGRRPQEYPVHGIDLSRFQGTVDWRRAAASGVRFAFVKATEGGDRVDPMLADNLRGARQAGVPVGAYHFYYFCTEPEVQARWFIRNVPRRRISLPPVLDLEWNPYSPSCTLRPEPREVRRVAARFIALLTDHYGQRPIIYTTPEFWPRNGIARLGGEFWLRSVADHPTQVYPNARWQFWQYSGTGRVPGISGRVDLNAFAGSMTAWQDWLARRSL